MVRLVKITERGWGGHFCASRDCLFRRNTLLESGTIKIVVSTVGNWLSTHTFADIQVGDVIPIGCGRYYETMVFHSDKEEEEYHDADVSREIQFDSPWCISEKDKDNEANEMHGKVVKEIADKIFFGEIKEVSDEKDKDN